MNTPSQDVNAYFATKSAQEVAGVCIDRSQTFFNVLKSNGYIDKLLMCWRFYYGSYNNDLAYGHQITFTGEQGELVNLPVNHFRNIGQHMLNMITSTRPVIEARAVNTDAKSMSQTYLANGILDYYMREKKLEDAIKIATEMSIAMGCGYIKMEWNATSGEAYDVDPDTGEFNYEGEIEFTNLSPLDVVVDGTKESWNNEWMICRSFQNRHNLIAKYPELKEKILGIQPKSFSSIYRLAVWTNDETDDIPVYEFFHKRTEALPEGRYILFLDSDIILLDTKLPYRQIPVFRMSAGNILGTPYAYTPMFDVYPIQEAINSLYGAIMTNNNAFAVQNLFVPRGADLSVAELAGGLNIVEGNAKPEPLQVTATPAETFKFLEMMIQAAETISGINSVTRGNPEASLKSGTALALVQSMSLQFISNLQQSYVRLIEDVGTALINILKDFATTPKVIALIGKNNRPLLKQFTGEDINAINRVIVDIGNPLSRTTAGRVQMAEQLLQMKLLKSPEQYFQVINTGRLDVTFQNEMGQMILIQAENERMLEGESPLVAPTDIHNLHIQEHAMVLNDPDIRKSQDMTRIVMDHMQSHLDFLEHTDPRLLQILGQQPIPSLEQVLNPQMQQGGQPGQPPQGALDNSPMEGMMEQQQPFPSMLPGGQGQEEPGLPELPKVDASLLPNPEAQDRAMGNVK